MKLVTRILLAVFLIIGAGFYYLTYGMLDNIRIRYLEGVEETLVDQARILASFVSDDMEKGSFSSEKLHTIFDHAYTRRFTSTIYQLNKTRVDIRVYMTDTSGLIIFDSMRKEPKGTDYSQWRDVSRTLQGKYGARSSREDQKSEETSVLYVAAPIMVNGDIAGTLTVAKPTTNINNFLLFARSKIIRRSIIAVTLVVVMSVLIIVLITRPIKRLTRYANAVRDGKKTGLPRLDNSEIGEMGRAFENMREALENRKYVEKYVQTLTHEIKSPVSAIKGAAELLEEEMPPEQRARFLENIRNESERIGMLVERMLELSSIESMKTLSGVTTLNLGALAGDVLGWMGPALDAKQVRLDSDIEKDSTIEGEPFLLKQAMSNLIQNSIDFSPPGATISVSSKISGKTLVFKVQDQGPGIPDFAFERLFEKFFSLQRPDSGKKSTGLGLNFVKEITELHNGEVRLENRENSGVCATLVLPVISNL